MPTISALSSSVTTEDDIVTIVVNYLPVFSELEKFLMQHGLRFREHIEVLPVDSPVDPEAAPLANFPLVFVMPPVPHDGGVQELQRVLRVRRATLQEDPATGDADEIRVRIRLLPVGLPHIFETLGQTHTLLG